MKNTPTLSVDELRTKLQAHNIKYLIPSFVDMHGVPKTKMVPIAHLEKMLACMVVPWRDDCAWFASDLWTRGEPFEACNRSILKNVLAKAEDMGFKVNCGIEAEFYVFNNEDNGRDSQQALDPLSSLPHLEKPAYDAVRLMDNLDLWLGQTIDAMNELGWDVYSFDHEDGIGQFEIDFNYADALTMADRFVFLRVLTNEIARQYGAYSTFMPKPFGDKAGSGAHYNMSLASLDGENLFDTQGGVDSRGCDLTEIGYHFIGGVMNHLPAIQAVSAPTVNSYKRLIVKGSTSGYTWAPCFVSYGNNNRTNTLRIPGGGGRVELRSADSSCNPYLGMAMMINAGLEGVRLKTDPGEPHFDNLYYKTDEERASQGVTWLPRTLSEAIDAFESDPMSKDVFGELMFRNWIEFKRDEWLSYQNHVSDWERNRYLK